MKLNWDYTALAATYDDRADYDQGLIRKIVELHGVNSEDIVLDLGAGTGKLTKELIACGLNVIASEPNEAMRLKGMSNVQEHNCKWISSPAENVEIPANSIASTWFGSSFNVVDHTEAFSEFNRYSKPGSWLTCLWNHRDLEDPIQKSVEAIFMAEIPGYSYGSRRQDPTATILGSRMFDKVEKHSASFEVKMSKESFIAAWKSHGTLQRQSKNQNHFNEIISKINDLLSDQENLASPYTTRLWTAVRTA